MVEISRKRPEQPGEHVNRVMAKRNHRRTNNPGTKEIRPAERSSNKESYRQVAQILRRRGGRKPDNEFRSMTSLRKRARRPLLERRWGTKGEFEVAENRNFEGNGGAVLLNPLSNPLSLGALLV